MFTFTEAQLMAWVTPVFWPFVRILAVFTAAPVFSSRAMPVRARIALAFLVALASQASYVQTEVIGFNDQRALGVLVQQVTVGLAIGFAVRVVFTTLELAGEVLGLQMGLNFASFFDPNMNNQVSAVGRFMSEMASLLFVVMNGHVMVLMAVNRSFVTFPIGQDFLQALAGMKIYSLGKDLFASALWIALPMLGLLMFANFAMGIISRVAPQLSIFSIGFPITLAVGLVGLTITLPMLDQPYIALMGRIISIFGG